MLIFKCRAEFLVICTFKTLKPSFHLRHVWLQSCQKPEQWVQEEVEMADYFCVSAQVCVRRKIRAWMRWCRQNGHVEHLNQTKDWWPRIVRVRGWLLIFRCSDIQHVGVYFCIWDSNDLKTGWKPNLKRELALVHSCAYVLSLKLCRHHYLSITRVHSKGKPTAFNLQPHLQWRSTWTQLSKCATFLAQPIYNQPAVEKQSETQGYIGTSLSTQKDTSRDTKGQKPSFPNPIEAGQYVLHRCQKLLYMCVYDSK